MFNSITASLAIVLFSSSVALADEPQGNDDDSIAYVVGVGHFSGKQEKQIELDYSSEEPPYDRAVRTANAIRGRVGEVVLLTTEEETTCNNIMKRIAPGKKKHRILIWYGYSVKDPNHTAKDAAGKLHASVGPKGSRLVCSDLDMSSGEDPFARLGATTIGIDELSARLLQTDRPQSPEDTDRLTVRLTVVLDVARPVILSKGYWHVSSLPVTADDWKKDDNATIISATGSSDEVWPNHFADRLIDTLYSNQGEITLNGFVTGLRKQSAGDVNRLSVPVHFGDNLDHYLKFVDAAGSKTVPVKVPDVPDPVVKIPDPVIIPKQARRRWVTPIGIGIGATCAATSAVSVGLYSKAMEDQKGSTTVDQYNAYSDKIDTFGGTAWAAGGCAAVSIGFTVYDMVKHKKKK